MTSKNKIYIVSAAWIMASAAMLGYFLKILDNANKDTLVKISEQKNQLALLEAEQRSFNMAQQDLRTMAEKPLQPENFFSRDVTLVREIKTLEDLGSKLKVNFALSGLSGTAKNAPKAKTLSDIGSVPYGISLAGPFPRIVDFIETMENLDFITHLTTMSLTGAGPDNANANLTAIFYLHKQ